jgi:hypothetical protein
MAIKVKCSGCGKTYQVKDEAAGKKIRCKDCEKLIPVPKPASSDDDWMSLDEPEDPDDDDEDDDSDFERRPRRSSRTPTKTKRGARSKRSKGPRKPIPGSLGASLAITVVGCVLWILLGSWSTFRFGLANQTELKPETIFTIMFFPVIVDVLVIIRVIARLNFVRYVGMIFDALVAVLILVRLVMLAVTLIDRISNLPPNAQVLWGRVITVFAIPSFVILIYLVDFFCLKSEDSADYMGN